MSSNPWTRGSRGRGKLLYEEERGCREVTCYRENDPIFPGHPLIHQLSVKRGCRSPTLQGDSSPQETHQVKFLFVSGFQPDVRVSNSQQKSSQINRNHRVAGGPLTIE
ncbi:hypothetical protein CEXT_124641 [Caerostris extrusa]|uniref:Uncharacterized protein n=1 Tax=Caerostris extrusa TaxID=172846 RepID=A0AAV4X5Z9_CAEEX|nr:hypothetical protein CEXT_124641 [Caerostris extrusa]